MSFHYAFPMEQTRHITTPPQAHTALNVIEQAGHSAWLVGGFVRDSLRNVEAHDLDIATDARWETVERLFERAGFAVHETGTEHGTVTVVVDGWPIEITTFRTEGTYSDSRHPDSVIFVDSIEADLARRDFTMNAIAYHPERGFADPFGGKEAIEAHLIECVGDPLTRFSEDALRIMRGVRFAAQLGFAVSPSTARAMVAQRSGLENVARERIQDELSRFLLAPHVAEAFPLAAPIVETAVPELAGLLESNSVRMSALLARAPRDLAARYAALFLGPEMLRASRPQCQHEHREKTEARNALSRLRVRKDVAARAALLLDSAARETPPTPQEVHRFAVELGGAELARTSLMLRAAFVRAAHPERPGDGDEAETCISILEKLVEDGRPFSVRDLRISGADLLALGIEPGPEIGKVLKAVLGQCIERGTQNKHDALLGLVSELKTIR